MICTTHWLTNFGGLDQLSISNGDNLTYLGMHIQTDMQGNIHLSQRQYTEKILKQVQDKLGPFKKPKTTPMVVNQSYNEQFTTSVNKIQYLQYVGLLNYLAVNTRPDILFTLSVLAQSCSNPTEGDMKRVLRVFQYLKHTKHYHLMFKPTDKLALLC